MLRCVALRCIFSVFNSTLCYIIFLTLVDEEGGFSFIRRMLSEGSIVALGSCSLHINDIIKYISIYRRFAMVSQILFYVWTGRSEIASITKKFQRMQTSMAKAPDKTDLLHNTPHVCTILGFYSLRILPAYFKSDFNLMLVMCKLTALNLIPRVGCSQW